MRVLLALALTCAVVSAQSGPAKTQLDPLSSGQPYVLGPGDQILIQAPNAEEISGKPFRIEVDGAVHLPLLGLMHPAGLTVEQFERQLQQRLGEYVRDPQLTLSVTQFRSETVTFAGAFRAPGVYILQGRHTLTEMLTMAGGLNENASRVVRIARQQSSGPLPVPNARQRADGTTFVADFDTTMADGKSPADEFVLKPFDVVTAFAVEPIVIGGEIVRPGIVPMGDHKTLPLMQVIYMSGGTTKDASRSHIKVYRQVPDSTRRNEMDVNLTKIQKGESPDVALLPSDLVIVPRSDGRVVSRQILAMTTGLALAGITAMMVTH